jgi:flagellar biosynthesis/type III secretory pathway chaperone
MAEKNLELFYFQVTDIWKRLCELHTDLLDATFEEYQFLLNSDIDKLEITLTRKSEIITTIAHVEKARSEIIDELNTFLTKKNVSNIESVSDLIQLMRELENINNEKHLFRFNQLLIDVIEKIQDQNKKNQLFINKAIHSLQEIKEDALGVKNYSTYNQKGMAHK